MGNFVEKVKKGVKWIGDKIVKGVIWLKEHIFGINRKTEKFIEKREEKIKSCKEPNKAGLYIAAKASAKQADDLAKKLKKDMDPDDLKIADGEFDKYSKELE